jgi:hypothetical protein
MSPNHDHDLPEEDFSRKKQTFFLSAEFLITMLIQSAVFLVVGTTVLNGVTARVAALESQQVTAERIARIEEKLGVLIENQGDFKEAIKGVQVELRSQRRGE